MALVVQGDRAGDVVDKHRCQCAELLRRNCCQDAVLEFGLSLVAMANHRVVAFSVGLVKGTDCFIVSSIIGSSRMSKGKSRSKHSM